MRVIAEHRIQERLLRLVLGDITACDVDAIVNAANSYLRHGGGVAGAIVSRGGQVIQEESDRIGYVPVGSAAITGAGRLRARFVIHAVGPMMGEGDEERKLADAVRSSLSLASERGLTSLSMPAISSGIFGFPKDRCAGILVREAKRFLGENQASSLRLVEFCILDKETLGYFQREFAKL